MQTPVRDEKMRIIGFIEQNDHVICYNHITKGRVGYYDTKTKIYTRVIPIPGRPMQVPAGTGDYGESDLRYWGV